MSVGEALDGRAPGMPVGHPDHGLPDGVAGWDDPMTRPVLRVGIESVEQTSARGVGYVLLRSPDDGDRVRYLRLTPLEWELALLMDGSHTVARLVAEFARIAGRLAPEEVRRVVGDLAANRMLEPVRDAGAAPRGLSRRFPLARVDGLFTALHRAGGRLLFTTAATVVMALVALTGLAVFVASWWRGGESVFVAAGSYLLGAVVLLVLCAIVQAARQVGRGLAAKHAGRAVPTGGVRLHLGIPGVYVDSSDVWMAGRRARMTVTAAGPATALVLAGAAQLAGLAVPALAGTAFKLAFVCYLHVLFALSPLLPRDGYHLLLDWLEIPQLRSRALSWVGGRLRRRPRGFGALDPEGRIVALYGMLAVLWTAIAVNVAYRIWADRVSPLVTGLWPDGAAARLLLLAVLTGVSAPVLWPAGRWAFAALRRFRRRAAERRRDADAPRRLAALRTSELAGLAEPALAALAARARWVHPSPGRQLVTAGASPAAVYVVVDGALQARAPGDPGGTVRHHVGPGGVVGLADALTGRTAALDWHTAGTTLLALPTAAVATIIGPLPGPPPADRAEAEALFADTPALASLAEDERLALIAAAHPADLEPGAPVTLSGPTHAVVVESGVIALPDGVELRRGTLVGPVGDGIPGVVAQARTPVRLWVLTDAASLPPLVGSARRTPASRTASGLRAGYPPLAVPPGPPDDADPAADHRFERRLWWLLTVAGLAALLLTGTNALAGPAWAELPGSRVLLTADRGEVTVVTDGTPVRLTDGERRQVAAGARIEAGAGSTGRLTFPGGGVVLLCAGSAATLGGVSTGGGDRPRGTLTVDGGRLLADTTATSGAFDPLALVVRGAAGEARNAGPAWFGVDPAAVAVASGQVSVGGAPVAPTGADLSCGDGVPVPPPAGAPSESPSPEPSESEPSEPVPSVTPSEVEPSVTESPSATPEATRTRRPAERTREPAPERTTIRPRPETPRTVPPSTTRPVPRPTRTTVPRPPVTTAPTTDPAPPPTTQGPTTTPPPAAGGSSGPGPSSSVLVAAVGLLLHLDG